MNEDNSGEVSFIVKKTTELEVDEISQINKLYNQIFKKNITKARNHESFIAKFKSNEKQYSFHGLMKKKNKIIGSYPVIPKKFKYFEKELFFGLVVDTLIEKKYRGNLDNMINLNNAVYEKLKKENIPFIYGIANKNYYPIVKKILNFKDVSYLSYYFKPLNLKKKNFAMTIINICLFFFNLIKNIFNFFLSSKNIEKNIFQSTLYIDNNLFKEFHDLKIVDLKKFKYTYKIKKEVKFNEKMNNLYIFDIFPMSSKNISETVKDITKNHKNLDFLFLIKNGKEKSLNLFTFPNFFLKNKIIVSGKILDSSLIKNNIFESKNWNLSLSNFDIK